MCPYQSSCSNLCPQELYINQYKSCARYHAANIVGIAAVPHDMTSINYALIEKLENERR
jgi:hypothetical protein